MALIAADMDQPISGALTLREGIAKTLAHGGIGVASVLDENSDTWITGTVGYHELGRAEIVIAGLAIDQAAELLVDMHCSIMRANRTLVLNEPLPLLERAYWGGVSVIVRRIHDTHRWALQPAATYYRLDSVASVRGFQLFWPDEHGYYPWDSRCCPRMGEAQLRLDVDWTPERAIN